MSASNVRQNDELDILSIIRELEQSRVPKAPVEPKAEEVSAPSPARLLESLQEKRKLIGLIDGYADPTDISEMKAKLNDAIADLEEIIGAAE